MNPTVEVMISTLGKEGLERVAKMKLPRVDGVAYLVSCQSKELPLPTSLQRDDVRVVFTDTLGLSNNRNNAIEHLRAPYAIVGDDDLNYYADGLAELVERIKAHPEIDLFTFIFDFPYQRKYPNDMHDLHVKAKNYHAISFEIGFRTAWLRANKMKFSPLMGIGAPYLCCGEEDMFVFNALSRGAKARFYSVHVGEHPLTPTLRTSNKPSGAVRAGGAVIILTHPYTMPLRLILKAKRLKGGFLRNLYLLIQGAAYGLKHRRSLLLKQ